MGSKTSNGTIAITDKWLEGFVLGPDEISARRWDPELPGFGVYIGPGRTSFLVQRRINGKQTTRVIGHWVPAKQAFNYPTAITAQLARTLASEALADMERGNDPSPSKLRANEPEPHQIANGRWQIRYRDTDGKRHISTFDTKADAQAALNQKQNARVPTRGAFGRVQAIKLIAVYANGAERELRSAAVDDHGAVGVRCYESDDEEFYVIRQPRREVGATTTERPDDDAFVDEWRTWYFDDTSPSNTEAPF